MIDKSLKYTKVWKFIDGKLNDDGFIFNIDNLQVYQNEALCSLTVRVMFVTKIKGESYAMNVEDFTCSNSAENRLEKRFFSVSLQEI